MNTSQFFYQPETVLNSYIRDLKIRQTDDATHHVLQKFRGFLYIVLFQTVKYQIQAYSNQLLKSLSRMIVNPEESLCLWYFVV